jgi:hypothetical protein
MPLSKITTKQNLKLGNINSRNKREQHTANINGSNNPYLRFGAFKVQKFANIGSNNAPNRSKLNSNVYAVLTKSTFSYCQEPTVAMPWVIL